MMVHRGCHWDNMGRDGKSKTLTVLLEDFAEIFLASSDTYRRTPESPQAISNKRKYSRFVPVDNFVECFSTTTETQQCGAGSTETARQGQRIGSSSVRIRKECQTACKPGSVRPLQGGTTIPLGRVLRRASRDQPGRRSGTAPCLATQPSLFGLAPGGVYHAAPVARGAVRSCRTVSPLPAGPANLSCTGGLFSVALSLGSPPPAVSRHRVSVEPGLSSTHGVAPQAAAVRLSGARGLRLFRTRGQEVRAVPAQDRNLGRWHREAMGRAAGFRKLYAVASIFKKAIASG